MVASTSLQQMPAGIWQTTGKLPFPGKLNRCLALLLQSFPGLVPQSNKVSQKAFHDTSTGVYLQPAFTAQTLPPETPGSRSLLARPQCPLALPIPPGRRLGQRGMAATSPPCRGAPPSSSHRPPRCPSGRRGLPAAQTKLFGPTFPLPPAGRNAVAVPERLGGCRRLPFGVGNGQTMPVIVTAGEGRAGGCCPAF